MRIARSSEGSLEDRINAERLAWEIQNQTVERLQSLGYLPSAPQKIVGDIYHHEEIEGEEKTLTELKEELSLLEKIVTDNGTLDDATKIKINSLKLRIEEASIAQDITDLTKKKTEENNQTKKED